MTSTQFRRIALGMSDAVEGAHMGHPDFRAANGRIFASLLDDETRGSVKLSPEQQAGFLERAAETFTPAAGAWGRSGWTLIALKRADQETVGEAVTLAWQAVEALSKAAGSRKAEGKRQKAEMKGKVVGASKKPAAARSRRSR